MRSQKPGRIYDNLWFLGVEESGVYLLRGNKDTVLVSGGLSYILPDVLTQMREFEIDPGDITKCLILHSHFDHVGIVPYFKRKYPAIEVLASEPAIQAFQNPKAIEFINGYNHLSAGKKDDSLKGFDLEWRTDIKPLPVREGDIIDLGGASLRIFEMPGHSNCSIAAYEPDGGILFASDTVGIPFSDKLFPAMNTNIEQYLNSLDKLRHLKVNIFCADHYGFMTGEEAGTIVSVGIKEATAWKKRMYDAFGNNASNIDAAAKELTTHAYREMPGYFLDPEILEGVFKQTLRYISRNLEAGQKTQNR